MSPRLSARRRARTLVVALCAALPLAVPAVAGAQQGGTRSLRPVHTEGRTAVFVVRPAVLAGVTRAELRKRERARAIPLTRLARAAAGSGRVRLKTRRGRGAVRLVLVRPAGAGATPGPAPGSSGGTPASTLAAGARWVPAPGTTWQWQLSGPLDTSVAAQVYDVDLFGTSAAQVAALHAKGRKVVCYLSAGTHETGRPDSGAFPSGVLGSALPDWPGERWLDVRNLAALMPIMNARMDQCAAKGFDGVEPDNIDGYSNSSGFPLTAAHQLAYNRALAASAHARGLSIGLKNDLAQVPQLVGDFDFAINEQCFEYGECSALTPFISAGKAVFNAEYSSSTAVCTQARALRFSTILKSLDLGVSRTAC